MVQVWEGSGSCSSVGWCRRDVSSEKDKSLNFTWCRSKNRKE